jgi:hypothetical protein
MRTSWFQARSDSRPGQRPVFKLAPLADIQHDDGKDSRVRTSFVAASKLLAQQARAEISVQPGKAGGHIALFGKAPTVTAVPTAPRQAFASFPTCDLLLTKTAATGPEYRTLPLARAFSAARSLCQLNSAKASGNPVEPGTLPKLVNSLPSQLSSQRSSAAPPLALTISSHVPGQVQKGLRNKAPRSVELQSDIAKKHRKPRKATVRYASERERAEACVSDEVSTLIPLLPSIIVENMLGGERGMQQVPSAEKRREILTRILSERAGTDGSSIAQVRLMLRDVREYGHREYGLTGPALDSALFPMSATLAHDIIATSHKRATDTGAGARRGLTVGDRLRTILIFASERLLWPIDVPRVSLQAAAPKAKSIPGKRKKAGTLPLAAKCQLEAFASDPHTYLADLSPEARAVTTFYARSFLAAGIDQSVRIAEGVRVELWPDEAEPDQVMRGHAYMGKDGSPIDIFAPAEGFLGPYAWYPTHLRMCLSMSQVFPAWGKSRGSRGAIDKATGFAAGVAGKADIRKAFKRMFMLPPLAYTELEMDAINIQGHTAHASPPEWARCIGENPRFTTVLLEPLPESLLMGFSDRDGNALGHWQRGAEAKDSATAAEAAASAQPGRERRAAAIASLPALPAPRNAMRTYYGEPGTECNRHSERWTQIRVRQRLAHTVRCVLAGRTWTNLDRGQADMSLLKSV